MSARRWVLVVTAVVVAVAAVVLVGMRGDDANKIATALSALAAPAAVGIAVWAAHPGLPPQGDLRVSNTRRAVAGRGGRANATEAGW
ncbi:hypothetical protein [Nonomuraea aurantiaca]|uniref:hypothetical protein n=1 Tax=Nonomuraea aurantiaca TaxID=2878562 RepID=UPI001CDA429A|nr:hypothetical protein [Nonomuraea aurantiaca]MCA2228305.1 hypothetical protein [Nonomuraea aurantiaca]